MLPIFSLVQESGNISWSDMYRTFNMGIGMIAVVKPEDAERAMETLKQSGEQPYRIGHIAAGERKVVYNGVAW